MLETFTGFIHAEHLWGQTYVDLPGKFGHPTTITPHRKPYKTKDGYLVVLPASRPASSQRRRVSSLTPSSSAASAIR